jgi:hypothetical protein
MKYLILAAFAANLAVVPAMAETPGNAMKAENSMKMESHDKMAGSMAMSGKKDAMAMKPMAMKKTDKKPEDKTMGAMSDGMPTKTDKDMKH